MHMQYFNWAFRKRELIMQTWCCSHSLPFSETGWCFCLSIPAVQAQYKSEKTTVSAQDVGTILL